MREIATFNALKAILERTLPPLDVTEDGVNVTGVVPPSYVVARDTLGRRSLVDIGPEEEEAAARPLAAAAAAPPSLTARDVDAVLNHFRQSAIEQCGFYNVLSSSFSLHYLLALLTGKYKGEPFIQLQLKSFRPIFTRLNEVLSSITEDADEEKRPKKRALLADSLRREFNMAPNSILDFLEAVIKGQVYLKGLIPCWEDLNFLLVMKKAVLRSIPSMGKEECHCSYHAMYALLFLIVYGEELAALAFSDKKSRSLLLEQVLPDRLGITDDPETVSICRTLADLAMFGPEEKPFSREQQLCSPSLLLQLYPAQDDQERLLAYLERGAVLKVKTEAGWFVSRGDAFFRAARDPQFCSELMRKLNLPERAEAAMFVQSILFHEQSHTAIAVIEYYKTHGIRFDNYVWLKNNWTLLHSALRLRLTKLAEFLIICYPDLGFLSRPDKQGNTALHYAYALGNIVILQRLLSKAPSLEDIRNLQGQNAREYAVSLKEGDIANLLAEVEIHPYRAENAQRNIFSMATNSPLRVMKVGDEFVHVLNNWPMVLALSTCITSSLRELWPHVPQEMIKKRLSSEIKGLSRVTVLTRVEADRQALLAPSPALFAAAAALAPEAPIELPSP